MTDTQLESVITEAPSNAEHPKLYENAAWGLGVIALVCVLAIAVLAALGKEVDAVVTGLVAIAASSVGGLVRLMEPKE